MTTPEPCLDRPCRSPVACAGFGYCRERNAKDTGAPTDKQMEFRRRMAYGAKLHAEGEARRARAKGEV